MKYIASPAHSLIGYHTSVRKPSFAARFIQWATDQDAENHIVWAGVSLVATAAVLFPITMAVTVMNGPSFPLVIAAMVSLVLVVALNLAAMPTRYTIPAFLLSILIDACIIMYGLLLR